MLTSCEMRQIEAPVTCQRELKLVFVLFSIWSFITLCRPQDYLPMLSALRPSLTLGVITLIVYFITVTYRAPIYKNSQFKLFLLLLLLMAFGVPFSYYRSASLQDAFDYISISLLFFILFYQVGNTVERSKSLLFTYCCGTSIYSIYILVSGSVTKERIVFGTMFDPNDIAFFIVNFFAFNLIFIKNESAIKRFIAIINIMLSLIVLFKTGSRGGLLACMVVIAYLLFKKTKTIDLSFITKAIIISLSLILFWSFGMNTERYKTLMDVTEDYNMTDETGRVAIWKIGLRMMLTNPLTGVGMGRFSEGVGRDRESRGLPSSRWQAPHNSFVQVGAEIGILGLILFAAMSMRVVKVTGEVIAKSRSADLVKISEMVRIGFIGHLVGAMFLSQAYSIYWVFYIVSSAKLQLMLEKEQSE